MQMTSKTPTIKVIKSLSAQEAWNENRKVVYDEKTTVKAFVVTPLCRNPHEMREILVINVFNMIFIAQFIN